MTATLQCPEPPAASAAPDTEHRVARVGLLRELERPREALANITPNWYAAVMGTGIVAVAAVSLPLQFRGLHTFAIVVWVLAGLLLLGITALFAGHWRTHRGTARSHHLHPVMAHFYGAPPMAMLTVGAGTLLLGKDVIGLPAAVTIDWVLWFAGTLTGLAAAAVVPYLQFTRHDAVTGHSPFGGWLMPVVPPMVSASTGALLVPHTPAGQARLTLVLCCYAMFGLALIASIVIITLIWYRLAVHKVDEAQLVPTLWIVLGPLGQSITAANLLGAVAGQALPRPYSTAFQAFGLVYGLPVFGFAVLWACLAGAITLRTARAHLPFSLTWWSFTFPVGTCVTGTSAIALHTGSTVFRWAAGLCYLGLVIAWVIVATRTARGAAGGALFLPAGAKVNRPAVSAH